MPANRSPTPPSPPETAEVEALRRALREKEEALARAEETLAALRGQLVRSEKMSTLGQFVAGIAHELNNPINFIYGNLDYLEEHVLALLVVIDGVLAAAIPADERAHIEEAARSANLDFIRSDLPRLVTSIRDGAERAASIVRDLRTLSHAGPESFRAADLNVGIAATVGFFQRRAGQVARIEASLSPLPEVVCNASQINQVVVNLVANAIDAVEKQGAAGLIRVRSLALTSSTVAIEVEDNGPGVDAAIRDRIFDPFFTTKPVGKGTGLGLAISAGIVKAHGGVLRLEASPEGGTVFQVALPVAGPGAQGG